MSAQSETFRLLQPDLWTIDELNYFLSQKGISFNHNVDKYQLLDIYKEHAMPMPQRKFPKSHHGQLINIKIIDEDKMHRKDEPKSRNDFQYGFKDRSSHSPSKQLISYQSPSTSRKDRLKPPIGTTSPPSKKICLSRRPSDQDLDKVVINDRPKRHSESSSDGSGSTHKREKLDEKMSSVKSHSSKKDTKERNKDRDSKEEPKPKRMRIGWP